MNWQLVHIAPSELQRHWPMVKPGIERVRIKGKAPWIAEDVYAAVKANAATMHIGYLDGRYAGVVVLAMNQDPFSGERSVLVWALYTVSPLALRFGLEDVKTIARKAGIDKIIFHSPRPGWERRMGELGFHVKERIYEASVPRLDGGN